MLIETGDESLVSIRAIGDAVGVTAPSIYRHFADKDELIFEVCQLQFQRLDAELKRAEESTDDPVGRLREMAAAYIRFGTSHPEQYRILLMSKSGITREDFDAGRVPGTEAFGRLMARVNECMDAGIFERKDPFLVASGLWALVHGVTSLCIAMPEFPFVGREALIDHVMEVVVRGLA